MSNPASCQEFLERARLLMETGNGWRRDVLQKEWERLQRQYMPSLWAWKLSEVAELHELERKIRKFINTRKK